ncbi:unnamed protein product [Lota lota]
MHHLEGRKVIRGSGNGGKGKQHKPSAETQKKERRPYLRGPESCREAWMDKESTGINTNMAESSFVPHKDQRPCKDKWLSMSPSPHAAAGWVKVKRTSALSVTTRPSPESQTSQHRGF